MEDSRPQHIFDELNPQAEQDNDDDIDEGPADDPDSMMFQWHGQKEDQGNSDIQFESARYK